MVATAGPSAVHRPDEDLALVGDHLGRLLEERREALLGVRVPPQTLVAGAGGVVHVACFGTVTHAYPQPPLAPQLPDKLHLLHMPDNTYLRRLAVPVRQPLQD